MWTCGNTGGDDCSLHGCTSARKVYSVHYNDSGNHYLDADLCDRGYKYWTARTWIVKLKPVPVVQVKDGEWCSKCTTYYKQSVPNQPDGTLICYTCRKYPFYGSKYKS